MTEKPPEKTSLLSKNSAQLSVRTFTAPKMPLARFIVEGLLLTPFLFIPFVLFVGIGLLSLALPIILVVSLWSGLTGISVNLDIIERAFGLLSPKSASTLLLISTWASYVMWRRRSWKKRQTLLNSNQ